MVATPDLFPVPNRSRTGAGADPDSPGTDSNADYVSAPPAEDAGSPWAALRRVHFFINDLIFRDFHPLGIGVNERRVLDALAFADARGAVDGLPVAALCKLIPPRTTPQTVGSVLERVRDLGWVEALEASLGKGRGRPWRLNDRGRQVRTACKKIVEMILQENYHRATTEQREALLAYGQAAAEFMDSRLGPVMHRADPAASVEPQRGPNWATLRRAHFFIHDLIFTEVEPIGVGVVERRILDALGFAAHQGATGGISTRTICALICAPMRSQAAASALGRMAESGWVESGEAGTGSRRHQRVWRLTPAGRAVRSMYKEYAESVIRDVHGRGTGDLRDLLALAQLAEQHRSVRLEPIIALANPPGEW